MQRAGATALSSFRAARLLRQLQTISTKLSGVEANWWHLIAATGSLDSTQSEHLDTLLGTINVEHTPGALVLWVMPRRGTISPWSSKATDIAARCGLHDVTRIERGVCYALHGAHDLDAEQRAAIAALLHDRMTDDVLWSPRDMDNLFAQSEPAPLVHVNVRDQGRDALAAANRELGLALSDEEIDYLLRHYEAVDRNPTDAELMMFAQANSEHCRHKIFNASWTLDGTAAEHSLFDMIRMTHKAAPEGVLSAYRDNAAVIEGHRAPRFMADASAHTYDFVDEPIDILMKVETHNHPTAISPAPGAATGSGGEIRDEGATGRGAKPKAGLVGFSVSDLRIPDFEQPWETPLHKPSRIASALDIMLEGPIGAAAFNNEFGRPNLAGYFRTLEQPDAHGTLRGYHKPIMLAGGMGNIRRPHVEKLDVLAGGKVIVLGGPAMLIGLGGGAASSMASGQSDEDLDFASVQRDNPEMQRRAQEVIDACWSQGEGNPIVLIHDVGAGGLSNGIPESVDHSGRGGRFELRNVPNLDTSMSPMAIWCNEAQERYVIVVRPERLADFEALCQRERCVYAVVGDVTDERRLLVNDAHFDEASVDMPMEVLLGKTPRTHIDALRVAPPANALNLDSVDLESALSRVLRVPAVASKSFLITIGDRTVGGLCARDQMVGPWQVPVSDVAVTLSSFEANCGEAMAVGERTPVAAIDGPASGRLAVTEALTNLMAADVRALADVRLSANWMAAAGHAGDDAALFDTVRAVGEALCPELGVAIPVGKDSLSMRSTWQDADGDHAVVAPVSLIVTAFSPVGDVRRTLTPELALDGESQLWLVELNAKRRRLGGSCLAQAYGQLGDEPPDLDSPDTLKAVFNLIKTLREDDQILAFHDRSDGGVLVSVLEMAFAARCGLDLDIESLVGTGDVLAALFCEEPGVVIQIDTRAVSALRAAAAAVGLEGHLVRLGKPLADERITVRRGNEQLLNTTRAAAQREWAETSYRLQALRDNPECAAEEFAGIDEPATALTMRLSFDPEQDVCAPFVNTGARPGIAILREQGVNGHVEMAAAFTRAGFVAHDVHMSDLVEGRTALDAFQGLVACGGFSYGDVLGAGRGWAQSILFDESLRQQFERFFNDPTRFAFGVCNGCQMMSHLAPIIPGAEHWPQFERNQSEQFEARVALLKIADSPSIVLRDMADSIIPVAIAHAEGRASHAHATLPVSARYVDAQGAATARYPANPNGSPEAIAAVCNADGRVTIMMPHPERVFRTVQNSWSPEGLGADGPWMRLFRNARTWLD
ncbi:MAG: phosphoribosylformylglycinamidine synthase [Gammaproteobacteria bacterium]